MISKWILNYQKQGSGLKYYLSNFGFFSFLLFFLCSMLTLFSPTQFLIWKAWRESIRRCCVLGKNHNIFHIHLSLHVFKTAFNACWIMLGQWTIESFPVMETTFPNSILDSFWHKRRKSNFIVFYSHISWWYKNIWERVVTGLFPFRWQDEAITTVI